MDVKITDEIVGIYAIFEILPVGVWILSAEGFLIDINKKGLELMGVSDKESIKGLSLESSPNVPEIIKEAFRKRETVCTSFSYSFSKIQKLNYYETSKNSEIVRVNFNGTPMFKSCGELESYIFTIEDITELYEKDQILSKNERRLAETELNLSLALEIGDVTVWGYNIASRCFYDIKGSTIESEMASIEERVTIIHPDDVGHFMMVFDKLCKRELLSSTEYFRLLDTSINEFLHLRIDMSVVLLEDGTIDRIVGVRRDITEEVLDKQKIEEALIGSLKDMTEINNLNESLNNLYNESQTILQALPVGISVSDKNGNQQYINNTLAQIFGITDMEAHKERAINLFEDPLLPREISARIRQGECFDHILEYDLQLASEANVFTTNYDHKMYFEGKSRYIKDSNGDVIKYILIINDITEKRRAELELKDSQHNLRLSLDAGDVDAWSYDIKDEVFYYVGGDSFGVDPIALEDDNNLVHPDDLQLRVDLMRDIVEGKVDKGQIIIRCMSSAMQNQYRYYDTRMAPKKENGAVVAIACAQRDITEKLKAELIIENSERNLKLALEAGNVESWSYDVKSEIFYLLGGSSAFGEDPITLNDDNKLLHPDDVGIRANVMNDMIQGKIDTAQIILRFRSNVEQKIYRYYDTRLIVQKEDNDIVAIAITHKDITDGYLHDIEREYSQKRVEFAINSAELALWEYDILKQEFVIHNNDVVDFEPVNGLSIEDYNNSLNLDEFSYLELNRMVSAMNSGVDISNSAEVRIKPKSASTDEDEWKHYTIGGSSFEKAKDGKVVKYVGFVKNNTKWVTLNDKLVLLNTQLETVLDIGQISPFVCDLKNDKFNFTAPIAKNRIFYMDLNNELTLDQVLMFFCPKSREKMENIAKGVINGDVSQTCIEIRWNIEALKDKVYEINISAVRDEDFKGSLKMIGYLQDVTERNQMISDLKEAKLEAEKVAKLKSSFLANMSHEIRTPLNAIVGFSELLIDEEDKGVKSEYLGIISTNNNLLLKLINDILDLSKIDAGLTDMDVSEFDFSQFFYELYLSMHQRITTPNVELSIINPYNKCIVELDKNRLAQICINYITNAIKYTTKGSIDMGYECVNEGIRLYVKDTGIGIADEKHHKVFQRFEKLDDFAQGTGLGLSITKALVESMGGEVSFESKEGSGSTFWAWIPCKFPIE